MDGPAQEAGGTHEGYPYYYYVRGGSRGAQPLWQGSGGHPQRSLFLLLRAGESRGAQPLWQGSGGHPQRSLFLLLRAGESRGAQPLWQGSGGVPQRSLISTTTCGGSPEGHSLFGRGLRVSPRDPLFLLLRAGESRGAQPLWQGSVGVPQRSFISAPFLPGRGPGEWSEPPLKPHAPKPKYRRATPPHPRLPRRSLLAMTGG